MNKTNGKSYFALGIIGSITFILCWEIFSKIGIISSRLFPPFSSVISFYFKGFFLNDLLNHMIHTFLTASAGYIVSALVAIPLGVLIGRSKTFFYLLEPILEFLRPLPASSIIPVAILFFGLGWKMNTFVVIFGSMWPILVATTQGARNVDSLMIDTAILFRFRKHQILSHVVMPASAPYIFAGLRTSLAVALILAITAEMIAGSKGIGFLILDMERSFRIEEMYAAIIAIGILGYCLNKIFGLFEKSIIYWK